MADDPTALFTVLDDRRVQATELARGPWDPRALHGGPVAALAARSLERILDARPRPGDPAFTPARFTLELERPVGLDPLTVDARVTRPGRSVRTAELDLHDDTGRRLARATLVAIRAAGPSPSTSPTAALPDDPPPPPPTGDAADLRGGPTRARRSTATPSTHAFVAGVVRRPRPGHRLDHACVAPVVDGEEPSPLQRVVAAADFGNGDLGGRPPRDPHLHQPRPHRRPAPAAGGGADRRRRRPTRVHPSGDRVGREPCCGTTSGRIGSSRRETLRASDGRA